MRSFLYKIPEVFVSGVASGKYKLAGAVIQEVVSGRIIGHVQQTGALDQVLKLAMPLLGQAFPQLQALSAATDVVSALTGGISVVQNEQIKSRLRAVQASLGLIQNMQIASLAVSGLGLGVSVVGFAVMHQRLNGIATHMKTLDGKIEKITADRRSDHLRGIFADVASELDTVETLSTRVNRTNAAEAAQRGLARSAGRLEDVFRQQADKVQTAATTADLEMLWSLAAAIRLCHEAEMQALFTVDELATAQELSARQASRFFDLSQPLSPDALARLCASGATSAEEATAARRAALPQAEHLVRGLRDSVASIGSQSALAAQLLAKGITGPQYLDEVAEEKTEPLLYLPV
jgi:hypothetical protein